VGGAPSDIIELSDYVYQRTRNRLAGLTDDEYFWEPVPGCCTIRRANSGEYRADDASESDPPPFTTIAWRLWHLIENYGGNGIRSGWESSESLADSRGMTRRQQQLRRPLPS
jgi:hypothetical protein